MFSPLVTRFRQQFMAAHGEYVALEGGFRYVFADGALMDRDPMGITAEPPEDPLEKARLIVKFWDAKLKRAILDFEEMKEELKGRAIAARRSGYEPPCDEDLQPLVKLQKTCTALQRKLVAAQAEVEARVPARIKNRVADHARNAQKAEGILGRIRSIKV